VNKNRKEEKQLKQKLDEFIQKDPFISMNNTYSTSPSFPYSILTAEELSPKWFDK
jgi:hypothetical protein